MLPEENAAAVVVSAAAEVSAVAAVVSAVVAALDALLELELLEPQPVIRLAANAAASTTAVIFFFIFSSFCIFDAVGNKKDAPGEFPTRLCERKEIVFVYTLIRVLIFVKYGSNFPQKIRFQGSPA